MRPPGFGVDLHPFDRAEGRAHAAVDSSSLERGPGRAGAADQELGIADHQLAVGADVEEETDVGRIRRQIGAQQSGRDVAAQVASHARGLEDPGVRVDIELQFGGPERRRLEQRRRIGLQPDGLRLHPQQ